MYVCSESTVAGGKIMPMERCVRRGSEYQRVSREVCGKIDEILATLTPETRRQLEEISNLKSEINVMENEDYFVYGFRLGGGNGAGHRRGV